MGWKINDWEKFEPPEQNDRDQSGSLKWWKCPVSQNRRYKLLVAGPNGWAKLGIWHAIVASWGRQTRESRKDGVLRTALAGTHAATAEEIHSDTGVPVKKLEAAIAKFLELGWLELESNCNPNGIQPDSETRLDKTKLKETKEDYIELPNCSKVELTQTDYDWLIGNWPKDKLTAMILEAEDFFCREPKQCEKRNHKLTIHNWLQRAEKGSAGRLVDAQGIITGIIGNRDINPRVGKAVMHIVENFTRWDVSHGNLIHWCVGMKDFTEQGLRELTKAVLDGSGNIQYREPSRSILANFQKKKHLLAPRLEPPVNGAGGVEGEGKPY